MHVIRDNYCISQKNVVSLHCVKRKTELTTKKTDCLTTKKKERKKENEKGSLENYLAGDYRCSYCRRHHARRYQLHVG